MKRFIAAAALLLTFCQVIAQDQLGYHALRTDRDGNIVPWFTESPAASYDHVLNLVWNFWDTMRVDKNGLPYYMNHQVWRPDFNDPRGIGGDQIQMALSSWHLLYQYSGNQRVKDNMRFLADFYLSHSLSPKEAAWPSVPYPYNTLLYSAAYDGDMVIGHNFTQPDKAGSFGLELVELYKMMSGENYPHTFEKQYLEAAILIANALAHHTINGDDADSPLPFKVNAVTGEIGKLQNTSSEKNEGMQSSYSTNWSGTMELFLALISLHRGDEAVYQKAFDKMLAWMKRYPMKSNRWGPFFEDVPGWSDTEINAMTWGRFIMTHQDLFPMWKSDVEKIIEWVYATLGNDQWKKYGVTVVNEQTAYKVPGNSHTARQAADELLLASLTGETKNSERAVRQLNWATYWVDTDGKNQFPTDDVWLTDGYGDYVRHYLRAMAAMPSLAPPGDHLLSSTSVVQQVAYAGKSNRFNSPSLEDLDKNKVRICYSTFDPFGTEIIRMLNKPGTILLRRKALQEIDDSRQEGFSWKPLEQGGVLTVRRKNGNDVFILE